jgi:hypothetical protein
MLWALTAFSVSPAIIVALAAATALLAFGVRQAALSRRRGSPAPVGARVVGLRSRARRTLFLRLRDPDAAGRPRPRAPSAASPAA